MARYISDINMKLYKHLIFNAHLQNDTSFRNFAVLNFLKEIYAVTSALFWPKYVVTCH